MTLTTIKANPGDIVYSYEAAPTLRAFSDDNSFVRGIMGPFNSGKSSACVAEIVSRAHEQAATRNGQPARVRVAAIRNTYRQLKDTTLRTVFDWLPPDKFGTWKETEFTYLITGFTGLTIELLFRALDRPQHVSNLLSLELTYAWVNEAREVPWVIIEALQARVGRYPSLRDGGAAWAGVFMDTNAPDIEHWWPRLFEEQRPSNAKLFKQPSGLSPKAENLPYIQGRDDHGQLVAGAAYYQNLAKGKDPSFVDVYVHGKYGFVVDGRPVYENAYAPALHDATAPIDPVPHVDILEGWDWGLTPATIWLQVLPGPRIRFLRELCSTGMGADRHSDDVLTLRRLNFPGFKPEQFKGWADPAGWAKSQTDEKTCVDICAAKGIRLTEGAVDFAARFEAMNRALRLTDGGRGAVQIDPRCTVLKKALLGGYHLKRRTVPGTGQERYSEDPEKNHPYSDIANAAEYPISKLFNVPTVTRMEIAKQEEATRSRWRETRGIGSGKGPKSWIVK